MLDKDLSAAKRSIAKLSLATLRTVPGMLMQTMKTMSFRTPLQASYQ